MEDEKDLKNILCITDKEYNDLINSQKTLASIECLRHISKDKTYIIDGVLGLILDVFGRNIARREGYEEGAKHYYWLGYQKGLSETLGLRTINNTPLSHKITNLLYVMGVRFSYHSKFGGMFYSQPKYPDTKKIVVRYEWDNNNNEVNRKSSSIESEIIDILDKAEKEILILLEKCK